MKSRPFLLPRSADLWLPGLLRSRLRRRKIARGECIDVFFCIADHFEPMRGSCPLRVERARVSAWLERFPKLAERFRDADGRAPQHTFFFPEEQYRAEHLAELARLCHAGFGEVEIHLHHEADSSAGLRAKLERFRSRLADHGLLCRERGDATIRYGFVHGNWALDNSARDGRGCGVNDEISILSQTGCYADFTLPSAPSDTQTRTVNSIYYAVDNPGRPKSHDRGVAVGVGRPPSGDLLLIQGPLMLDWRRRKWGWLPGLENGSLHAVNPPTAQRFELWLRAGISVVGRPQWVFVKVYTHGAQEENAAMLLGPVMERFHTEIAERFNDGRRYRLHYVTARELANLVWAAEAGEEGEPRRFRDYRLVRRFSSPPDEKAHGESGGDDSANGDREDL